MKIIVSQQNLPASRQDKKIIIEFQQRGKLVDKCRIDKADDFLVRIDKFLRKRNNLKNAFSKTEFKFLNVGMLTERIVKAIIKGLILNI